MASKSSEKSTEAKKPNILVTGTPAAGKSYLCERLAKELEMNWLDCSKIAKEQDCIDRYDDVYECPIINEDKLLDYMEPLMQQGGQIVEYHGCDFFPERWFQAVYVVTCPTTEVLYDRLKARGYSQKKLQDNMECEIFGTILEEANDSYNPDIVTVLEGITQQDAEDNIAKVKDWFNSYKVE